MTWATDPDRESIGRQRLHEFMVHHGMLQGELLTLTMSILGAPPKGYSDEVLAAIVTDANDLRLRAREFCDWSEALVDEWRRQREATDGS